MLPTPVNGVKAVAVTVEGDSQTVSGVDRTHEVTRPYRIASALSTFQQREYPHAPWSATRRASSCQRPCKKLCAVKPCNLQFPHRPLLLFYEPHIEQTDVYVYVCVSVETLLKPPIDAGRSTVTSLSTGANSRSLAFALATRLSCMVHT